MRLYLVRTFERLVEMFPHLRDPALARIAISICAKVEEYYKLMDKKKTDLECGGICILSGWALVISIDTASFCGLDPQINRQRKFGVYSHKRVALTQVPT
jgi:hypothetical protein